MKNEFQRALAKGLPYPILTISEYLSQDGEGFNWGRHYRIAGYYTSITLWLAFASWILMNILLCAVPRYGVYTMQFTGALMLLSNFLYSLLIPTKPLRIPFEGSTLIFNYGMCFWLVFSADYLYPNKFSTILEVDYDTPYRYFVGNDMQMIGSLPPPLNAYYYHHNHQSSLSMKGLGMESNVGAGVGQQFYLKSKPFAASIKTKNDSHQNDNQQHLTASKTAVSFSSGSEENASSTAQEDDRDENDELSDVSTTIIDGKRAISLSNFGKYAEREGFELYHRNSQPTFGYPMASAGFRANKNNFIK
ncbi:hypothetical protein QR98_0103450 [Sarcoptes scabiei]|uniref:Uncharacterized protein n=1 Tax=Sarcoptes scabiei TaxID=52283 RepID=A0A132AMM6_SARSC|nr:hypothetical protein QR98_0103450 [Sarcoptes scabiei]